MLSGWRSGWRLWWRPSCRGIANRRFIESMVREAGWRRLPVNIGSIDLLMTPKTQRCAQRRCRSGGNPLEFLWRTVTQRRMQSTAVVILIDEFFNVGAQVFQIGIAVGVNFFAL